MLSMPKTQRFVIEAREANTCQSCALRVCCAPSSDARTASHLGLGSRQLLQLAGVAVMEMSWRDQAAFVKKSPVAGLDDLHGKLALRPLLWQEGKSAAPVLKKLARDLGAEWASLLC